MSHWKRAALAQQRGLTLKKKCSKLDSDLSAMLCTRRNAGGADFTKGLQGLAESLQTRLHCTIAQLQMRSKAVLTHGKKQGPLLFFSKKQTVTNRYSVK